MPGIPVPSDPNSALKCYRVYWPEGGDWYAVLLGMITRPAKAFIWGGSEEDVEDCQENVLRAFGETLDDGDCVMITIGVIVMWQSNDIPAGWLLCDGSSYDTGLYADLFNALGVNLLPDLTGRGPVGRKIGDPDFGGLNGSGGAKTHVLSTAEMPAHTHGITDGVFTGVGTAPDNRKRALAGTNGLSTSAGGGGAHNNLQPYRVTNFIIRAV